MSPYNNLSLINQIEDDLDVWSWELDGVPYWPLLRIFVWMRLLSPLSELAYGEGSLSTQLPRLTGTEHAVPPQVFDSRGDLYRHAYGAFRQFRRTDVLLLSRVEDNIDHVSDLVFDRMIDPSVSFFGDLGVRAQKVLVANSEVARQVKGLGEAGPVVYPDGVGALRQPIAYLQGIDALANYLASRKSGVDLRDNDPRLRSLLKRFIERSTVFGALLDRVRPRMVMLAVFNDPRQMAAVFACRSRGIPVVDIQHGRQGPDHVANLPWHGLPQAGSQLLPDYFWVWGEESASRISRAMAPAGDVHRPLKGGNAWLAQWAQGAFDGAGDVAALVSRGRAFRKRILVTLQPISDPLVAALGDALRYAPQDWIWWIRLHRKQYSRLEELRAQLSETGAQFEIDEPTRLPLYALIREADRHVTAWSTVAFEADALGCPTTLCDPRGQEVLAKEISAGRFGYAESGEELLKILADTPLSGSENLEPYIIADPAHVRDTLSWVYEEISAGRGSWPKELLQQFRIRRRHSRLD